MICSFIHADVSQTFKITTNPGNIAAEGGSSAKDFWVLSLAVGCVIAHKCPQDCSLPLLPPLVLWHFFRWRARCGAGTASF